jgi:hypothetical protein
MALIPVRVAAMRAAVSRNVDFREVGVGGNIEIHEIYVW